MKGVFTEALYALMDFAIRRGVSIIISNEFDSKFKGDLDGANIWIAAHLDDEEKLFNALHLFGHTVQWAINQRHKEIGAKLWKKPSDEFLEELVQYEHEASCLGLSVLQGTGFAMLRGWLTREYRDDIYSLIHYYKTGKFVSSDMISESYPFPAELKAKPIPYFKPKAEEKSRRGIVIDFKKEAV